MTKHQFFQGFIPQQEQVNISNITPELAHNLMVFEISNNWDAVNDLLQRSIAAKGKEIKVDFLEMEWTQFITKNKIDILSYENEEDFVNQNLKPLVKEETKSSNKNE